MLTIITVIDIPSERKAELFHSFLIDPKEWMIGQHGYHVDVREHCTIAQQAIRLNTG